MTIKRAAVAAGSGIDRAALYMTAILASASELAALRRHHSPDSDPPTASAAATPRTSNWRYSCSSDAAAELNILFSGAVWRAAGPGTWSEDAAEMLRPD